MGYLLYGMVQSQFRILRVGNERKPLQGNGLSPNFHFRNAFKASSLLMPLRLALSFGTQLGIFRSEIRNSIVYGIVQIQYGRIEGIR